VDDKTSEQTEARRGAAPADPASRLRASIKFDNALDPRSRSGQTDAASLLVTGRYRRVFKSWFRKLAVWGVAATMAGLSFVSPASAAPKVADDGLSLSNESILVPDYTEMLWSLAGSQSKQEIDRIANSGHKVQLLVDPKAGKILAAIDTERTITPSALTRLGPGCSTTSLCMMNDVPNGYIGTGSLSGTWRSVYRYATGDRIGTFRYNGLDWTHAAYITINLTTPETITYIARR
jgi:hypothetical protein